MHSSAQLAGSVVLVSGASRGIGRAVAAQLAEAGCDVALLARSIDGLNKTARICSRAGGRALILPVDASDRSALKGAVERTVTELGGLHILVNNAGVSGGGTAADLDLDEARRLLASALVDMAETNLLKGEPLPQPDPVCTDPDADLEEPIHLLLKATSRVILVPQ